MPDFCDISWALDSGYSAEVDTDVTQQSLSTLTSAKAKTVFRRQLDNVFIFVDKGSVLFPWDQETRFTVSGM